MSAPPEDRDPWADAALTVDAVTDLVLAIAEDAEDTTAAQLAGAARWLREVSADLHIRARDFDAGFADLCRFLDAPDNCT